MTESNVPDPTTTAPPSPVAAPIATQPIAYAGPSTAYPGPYSGPAPDQNAKTMGMLCHLLAFSGFIIPLGTILGPLVMWQLKKKDHPFIDDQGKEALNFAITTFIALVISAILIFVLVGLILLPAVAIAWIILTIIATMKANNGIAYRYPFALRFIK
jgi:uncharacterized protein